MQLGLVGLGKMGGGMARRLMRDGHAVVAHDRSADAVAALAHDGATGARSLDALVATLDAPRAVWVMVPAGGPTESVVSALGERLEAGDTVIDGGNSLFKDDVRRARALGKRDIGYLDVGVSGGVWGLEKGYCLMIGGDRAAAKRLEPIFTSLAPGRGDIERTPGREKPGRPSGRERSGQACPDSASTAEDGWLYCGPAGAGHFVKMVHNGIEYGLMQAYAEGFDILRGSRSDTLPEEIRYELPLSDIAEVWRRGSVIRSWLLDLTASALLEDDDLDGYSGFVTDSGEGRWTVESAIEEAVPAHVITAALFARFRSRQQTTFADKILSAMRHKFGGHVEPPERG